MRDFFRRRGITQLPGELGNARVVGGLRQANFSGETIGRRFHEPCSPVIATPSSTRRSARRDTDRAESRHVASRTANDPCPERFHPASPAEVLALRRESARGNRANAPAIVASLSPLLPKPAANPFQCSLPLRRPRHVAAQSSSTPRCG